MQRSHTLLCVGISVCLVVGTYQTLRSHVNPHLPQNSVTRQVPSQSQLSNESFAHLPLAFERNEGQTDKQVQFLSRGPGYHLFLTANEAVLALHTSGIGDRGSGFVKTPRQSSTSPEFRIPNPEPRSPIPDAVVRLKLLGSNPHPGVEGQNRQSANVNYFIGNDPTKWRSDVPTYSRVQYKSVYSGIDMVYYGNQRQLEYDWVVAPGADLHQIRLAVSGAEKATVTAQGDLLLHTDQGDLVQHAPVVYQEIDGVRKTIPGRLLLQNGQAGTHAYRVGFEVAAYDHSRPLVIDPVLVYSTYLGGSDADTGQAVAVDSYGNAYVTGATSSVDFPINSAFQSNNVAGTDSGSSTVFVYEMNSSGTALLYATYLGGSVSDQGNGIAVDSAGNAYVAGFTKSANFPTKNALYATLPSASGAAFVTKLNAGGATLGYSTYLGGSAETEAYGIAVDTSGNAYVAGGTNSTNFPILHAVQAANGGGLDAFVTKINPTGTALVLSTYLGGSGNDTATGIAVDSSNNIAITGNTTSINFPVHSAAQASAGGGGDAFVSKISASGSSLIYSTYLGGSGLEHAGGIALDSAGNAYITGDTRSTNFPVLNAYQGSNPNPSGVSTAFVTKLTPSGSGIYSTYLGGSGGGTGDSGHAIAVDSSGNAYVTGSSSTTNFPTLSAIQATSGGNGDAFVTRLGATGALLYSTYLGGSGVDSGNGIAVDSGGNAYVTGTTSSVDLPVQSPLQPFNISESSTNSFLTRIGKYNAQVVALSVAADANARLLWTSTNQTVGIWSVNASGQTSNTHNINPINAWTIQSVSSGPNVNSPGGQPLCFTDILWTKTDGTAALWEQDWNNNYAAGSTFGPTPGWRAVDNAFNPQTSPENGDEDKYILWNKTDGTAALWLVEYGGGTTLTTAHTSTFGPYPDWTANHVAMGTDELTRLLWTKNDGTASIWILDQIWDGSNYSDPLQSSVVFGPYPGWRAIGITVASDDNSRLLWTKSDGTVGIWTVPNSGIPTNYVNFGPYPGWTATKIASAGGQTYLSWFKTDGTQALWTLNSDNTYNSGYTFGPY